MITYWDKIFIFEENNNFYWIWNISLYKNINMKKFINILKESFLIIKNANQTYTKKDLENFYISLQK